MRRFRLILLTLAAAASSISLFAGQQENAALARRVFDEILSGGNFELASKLYAPDFKNHGITTDVGLDVDQAAARGWKQVAPDLRITPELVIAEGDLVAVLWRARGTNTGEGNGLPATGKRCNQQGITIWRIADGRIKEEWSDFSMLAILRQLGLAPGGTPVPADGGPMPRAYAPASSDVGGPVQERNRTIVKSLIENNADRGIERIKSVYALDLVKHGLGGDSTLQDEIKAIKEMNTIAPDRDVRVMMSIAQGDLVAALVMTSRRPHGSAAEQTAHKPLASRTIRIMRVGAAGKIAEEWSVQDWDEVREQLGLNASELVANP